MVNNMANSHWMLSDGAFEAVRVLSNPKSVIVEFGSGEGTERLTRLGKIFSIEHDENWILGYLNVEYIHAPLVDIEPLPGFNHKEWYDSEVLEKKIPSECDIVIVDGPLGSIGRSGLLRHLSLFPKGVTWIIDDTNRDDEALLANHISLALKLHHQKYWNFSILSLEPIDPHVAKIILGASWREIRLEEDDYIRKYYPAWGVK